MDEIYLIPQDLIHQIITHLQANLPEEACGLLAGKDHTFQTWIPINNILRSPTRYRMDAEQQLKAFLEFEQNQQDLMGIVHSHPSGPQVPSETDIREAFYPEAIYFIFFQVNEQWDYKAYCINQKQTKEVKIQVLK
ncbi:MAG: M67 family metallopeptidase [Anaerolineales bacterium]